MARFYDRVKASVSGTPGTGTVTVGSAASGYRTPATAGAVDGEVLPVVFEDGSAWEESYCTLNSSATVLTRSLKRSSTGSLLSLTGAATFFVSPFSDNLGEVSWFRQEQTSGTNASDNGMSTGAWVTRALNTSKLTGIPNLTRSSSTLSVPAGTYEVMGFCTFASNAGTRGQSSIRIRNTTDGADLLVAPGLAVGDDPSLRQYCVHNFHGQFTLTGTKNVEVQQKIVSATGGLAFAEGTEVYVDIYLRKVA